MKNNEGFLYLKSELTHWNKEIDNLEAGKIENLEFRNKKTNNLFFLKKEKKRKKNMEPWNNFHYLLKVLEFIAPSRPQYMANLL